jgi:hypothetical protein
MDFDATLVYFFQQIAAAGALVTALVQMLKPVYQERWKEQQRYIDFYLSAFLNVFVIVSWQVDLFGLLGFPLGTFWGSLLTGVIASFGSTVLHETVSILIAYRKGLQQKNALVAKLSAVADDCDK